MAEVAVDNRATMVRFRQGGPVFGAKVLRRHDWLWPSQGGVRLPLAPPIFQDRPRSGRGYGPVPLSGKWQAEAATTTRRKANRG